jgi:RecA/RadA recombinase
MTDDIERIKERLTRKTPKVETRMGLSTGNTLLNLALTDTADVGYLPGNYYYYVGDSRSGKSWTAFTCFAEACANKAFKDYALIFHDIENGVQFDVSHYFGAATAKRVEYRNPTCLEAFYDDLDASLTKGPGIHILDSMDALRPAAEVALIKKQSAARDKGTDTPGSYGTDKAKINSARLRNVVSLLQERGSIFLMISQTRDNIGFGAQLNPKTRSGGKSLTFYAHLEIWTSVVEKIRVKVNGKDRTAGSVIRAEVKKNRQTGAEPKVELPLLHGSGFDDVGGCIRFLIEEGHWKPLKEAKASTGPKKAPTSVVAPEFDHSGSVEALVKVIEDSDAEPALRQIVQSVWSDIRDKSQIKRKARYT